MFAFNKVTNSLRKDTVVSSKPDVVLPLQCSSVLSSTCSLQPGRLLMPYSTKEQLRLRQSESQTEAKQ